MKKLQLSITEFKRRYNVLVRKLFVVVCSFTVSAYSLASTASEPVRIVDEFTTVKTEVPVSGTTAVKEKMNSQILEIASQNQLGIWEEAIDEVCSWPENWDEEGASAVMPEVGESAKKVLHHTKDFLDLLDNIYPTVFGSICLEWGRDMNWINAEITENSYHFYHGNGGVTPEFVLPFSNLNPSNLDVLKDRLSILRNESNA